MVCDGWLEGSAGSHDCPMVCGECPGASNGSHDCTMICDEWPEMSVLSDGNLCLQVTA